MAGWMTNIVQQPVLIVRFLNWLQKGWATKHISTNVICSGLNRKSAAKFSFMMSAPAIVGALIIDGKTAIEEGWVQDLAVVPTLVGILVAAVSGYIAIRFMLSLISRVSLNWFALYVAILGVLILVLQLIGYPGTVPFVIPDMSGAVTSTLRFWNV